MGVLGPLLRVAAVAAFLGAFLGALADLRLAGQGLGTLLLGGLAGYAAMGVSRAFTAAGSDGQMWAMMAGMAGGGLGGLLGAALAAATVAELGAHLHTMDWSMLLMGGSMGGMLGATLGGSVPAVHRSRVRLAPRIFVWRLRRSA